MNLWIRQKLRLYRVLAAGYCPQCEMMYRMVPLSSDDGEDDGRTHIVEIQKPIISGRVLSQSLRFSILRRDDFQCQYCGRKAPEVVLEVDHVVPISFGGDNKLENLRTSCRDCNQGKRDVRL